jgi:hypothetical protein
MDAADDVGITPYILKMAVVQAGREVTELEKDHEAWMTGASAKMAPLLSGQQAAMAAKKALQAANQELGIYRSSANDKSKKVLMSLMGGQSDALKHTCFNGWADCARHEKQEKEIRVEYEVQIDKAEKALFDYVEAKMKNVRGVLGRKGAERDRELMQTCFSAMATEIEERKKKAQADLDMKEVEGKLKSFSDNQMANTKKVMTRMSAGSDATLTNMCFQEWVKFCEDYKKNFEMEEAVKAAEKKVAEFMKRQSDSAKGVLGRMNAGSETGIMHQFFTEWATVFKDERAAAEMAEKMDAAQAKMSGFNVRNKASAMTAMCRNAEVMDRQAILMVFGPWKKEARVEKMKRYGKEKNEKKKAQLNGVKGLFRNFASELETGLKDGTPRIEPKPRGYPDKPQAAPA